MECIVACIYRPGAAPATSYQKMMSAIQNYLNSAEKEGSSIEVIVTGDFNFPTINWENNTIPNTLGKDVFYLVSGLWTLCQGILYHRLLQHLLEVMLSLT